MLSGNASKFIHEALKTVVEGIHMVDVIYAEPMLTALQLNQPKPFCAANLLYAFSESVQ